jgi:choline-sulfatase
MAAKPNILVIMTDQHDPAVSGCYGDSVVKTPNIDRIASQGVLFEACYTPSPLCVPARLSFTAGKYIDRIGAWNNNAMLKDDNMPTIARIMNDAGYESLLCGKMHYEFTKDYGFTKMLSIENNHIMTGINKRRKPGDARVNRHAWDVKVSEFHTAETTSKMQRDIKKTRKAIDFIKSRRASDKPFFLVLGYISPHSPFTVPSQYYDMYKDKVPMPELPPGLVENLPLNYKQVRMAFGYVDQDPAAVKLGRECYWALVSWIDNEIGKVLTALEASEVGKNTVVIYTADHGENKGDHGLWWKNNVYDHAARIPLIISWPNRWKGGQRRAGACGTLDLVRTITEIGQASVPSDWDGTSLVSYLDDGSTQWKDVAISEYYAHNVVTGITMIRKGDFKYVYHNRIDASHEPDIELFNMKKDPKEFNNLARDAAHAGKVEELHAAMVAILGKEPASIEQTFRDEKPYYKSLKWWTLPRIAKLPRVLKKIKSHSDDD